LSTPVAKPFRVVLLGPPASGKGTQGRRLAASLGLGYLSTGALLREHVENGTELGKQAKPILDRGEYLPDGLMCPILADWLDRQTGGWVLDGFPRSVPQAVFLDQWLDSRGMRLDAAISLEVPFDELLTRIRSRVECPECRWSGQRPQLVSDGKCPKCGSTAGSRADDTEDNFTSRHAEFVSLTEPVIERYRGLGLLSACDATAAQDEVSANLLKYFPGSFS
jgi:adenylate kinase